LTARTVHKKPNTVDRTHPALVRSSAAKKDVKSGLQVKNVPKPNSCEVYLMRSAYHSSQCFCWKARKEE